MQPDMLEEPSTMRPKTEATERFLDYLIYPNECIDTFGRTYIDDLEYILVENHAFDFQTQAFPDQQLQQWFDQVRSDLSIGSMQEFITYVRAHRDELDLANVRPRVSFDETPFKDTPTYHTLREKGDSIERSNAFQRDYSYSAVDHLPKNEDDPDYYELYMSHDRVNPWTYLIRREIARGNMSADDPVICIGNRWLGEILYFRQNLGLKRAQGLDLFSRDPELVIAADMHKMPWDDNSVGMIFARGLINKSYDVRLLFQEMVRVLKADGFLIIETPVYRQGVSRLGRTDVKSTKNLMRLLRGKVRRIVYSDELDDNRENLYASTGDRLVRFFVQLDKNGQFENPIEERFPQRKFEVYNAGRLRRLRERVEKRLGVRVAEPAKPVAQPKVWARLKSVLTS
jgi:SAM-dependent methyltransferase